jgi:hypothetical protein
MPVEKGLNIQLSMSAILRVHNTCFDPGESPDVKAEQAPSPVKCFHLLLIRKNNQIYTGCIV